MVDHKFISCQLGFSLFSEVFNILFKLRIPKNPEPTGIGFVPVISNAITSPVSSFTVVNQKGEFSPLKPVN